MRIFAATLTFFAFSSLALASPQVHPFRFMNGEVTLQEHGDGCYLACYAQEGVDNLRQGGNTYLVGLLKVSGTYLEGGTNGAGKRLCHPWVCQTTASRPGSSAATCRYIDQVDQLPEMHRLCADAFANPTFVGRHFWAGGDTLDFSTFSTEKVVNLEKADQ